MTQWGDIAWRTMYKSFYNWGGTGFSAEDVPDLSNVRSINRMFFSAHIFNGDLSNWDVSNVTDMRNTFTFTDNFNGDLSAWDVSNVLSMQGMFYWALSFNGDISAWDVSNVKNMSGMFRNTAAFNSDISAWDVRKVTDMSHMFYASAFSPQNYDQILIGWAALDSLQTGVELGVGLTFCQGAEAREYLIDKFSWDIRDDGLSCSSEANARSLVLVDETSDIETEAESIDTEVLLTYPNPVQNVLYVKTKEHVQVSMTNISGKQVIAAQAGSQFELDMSQITMGVYLLIIQSGDSITTKRIIKNNY